jgi:mycofactocin precursor
MCDALRMSRTLTLPSPPPVTDEAVVTELPGDKLPGGELLVEGSLVEEVSIDGMCGVY